ncbi:MAG TPA: ATP-binding protein [Bacteroidales bacterium]|nr:ATP-binding protein [Bacteroidales bacterium]
MTATNGVLDLRQIENHDHFILKLNGEWEFYWKEMLRPHDFDSASIKPDYYGNVPSYWTDYPKETGTTKFGYATYRLKLFFPEGFRNSLAIDLPIFNSAYDIYIDGKYIGGNGITGKSADESEPEYRQVFARVNPVADSMEIIINISNYDHRRGGFWIPVRLGTFAEVQKNLANSWALNFSVISLLLSFSLLFIFFYFFSRKEKIMLSFSMLAFGLTTRPLFTMNILINNFVSLPWEWIVRLEYIGLAVIIISLAWFARYLYPCRFIRITALTITAIFSINTALILFMPVSVFTYSIIIFYPSIMLLMLFLLVMSIKGVFSGNKTDIIYSIAFFGMLLGGINDIVVSLGRTTTWSKYVISGFVMVFIFIQAILVLFEWVKAFHEKEKLRKEMEFLNKNLEKLIADRTTELQKRNDEIQMQNTHIALQNKQLTDTISLRNKMFSVIAHDLRSPVVNILYMLNLLKEKEFKEKYDSFANSSIDYAQRVINLLENMLVWGQEQEDKIKYSPSKNDLADIILTNLSIFKESADKKEISINFSQLGNSIAQCDKDLMDIVIRNLLSNAIKYTPRKGRISIILKDKRNTGEGITVKICDNGQGISLEKQKLIFSSEDIESTPGTENEKGTGLGLKLCHELIRISNGSLSVESTPGKGSCFTISLKCTDVNQLKDQITHLS